MKVLLQNLSNGKTSIEEVPFPAEKQNFCIIQSTCSLISIGTEKMLLNFGKANFIDKARQQPDKLAEVFQKIKQDGLSSTIETVKSKLETPIPLGYSNVGKVIQYEGNEFKIGDRVVSNGSHADVVQVNKNLVCKIPNTVSDEEASFAFVAAIGLQSIRLLDPKIGDQVAVIGLGLIGNLTVQLLMANGCRVIAFDNTEEAVMLAKQMGINAFLFNENEVEDLKKYYTNDAGVDGVIITASSENKLFNSAAKLARQRAKIILTGVIQNDFNRDLFYKKELSIQLSSSYGPGRYDPVYEERGIDYPYGLVRWTERRNVECVLELLAEKKLDVLPLVQKHIPFDDSIIQLYQNIENLKLANIINYTQGEVNTSVTISSKDKTIINQGSVIALIGLGGFARKIILPYLKKYNLLPNIICSNQKSIVTEQKKYNIANITSDINSIIQNESVNFVYIANQHNRHGQLVLDFLKNGKSVYVEKPLCIHKSELEEIKKLVPKLSTDVKLIVGYNRRYSKFTETIKRDISGKEHLVHLIYTINAGYITPEHWINDPNIGGGRIIGEVCHFVDWSNYVVASEVISVYASCLHTNNASISDSVSITLKYKNGSQAVIHYLTNGNKTLPKENIKLYCTGQIIELDNFRKIRKNKSILNNSFFSKQDKGFDNQFKIIKNQINNFDMEYQLQIIHVSEICFAIQESLKYNKVIQLT